MLKNKSWLYGLAVIAAAMAGCDDGGGGGGETGGQAGGGDAPLGGETGGTPPAGGEAPPEGGQVDPPVGGEDPPVGGEDPPVGGQVDPPVGDCPADWNVIDLSAAEGWAANADNSAGAVIGGGSCGGGETTAVFAFTAESAGVYNFASSGEAEGVDTVVYAISTCGADAAELACSDDVEGLYGAVGVLLEADQTIYIVVDNYEATPGGPISLTATQLDVQAPVLAEGRVVFNPDAGEAGALAIEISGTDADDDVVAVGLALIDAEGNDIVLATDDETGETFTEAQLQLQLEQGEGAFAGTSIVELPADLPAFVQARLFAVDEQGLTSNALVVDLEAPAQAAAGDECDPAGVLNMCPEGDFACSAADDVSVCVAATAPAIEAASGWFLAGAEGGLALRGTGADAEDNMATIAVRILDGEGGVLTGGDDGLMFNPTMTMADGSFEFALDISTLSLPDCEEAFNTALDECLAETGDLFGCFGVADAASQACAEESVSDFDAAATAEIRPIDATDRMGEWVTVELQAPADSIAMGEACSTVDAMGACAEGSACFIADEADYPVCNAATKPTVSDLQVVLSAVEGDNGVALLLRGLDPEADVRSLRVVLFNGEEAVIGGEADGGPFTANAILEFGDAGTYTALFAGFLPEDIPVITSARVSAVDASGLESDPITADVQDASELLESGAICHPSGLMGPCDEAEACVPPPEGIPRCGEVVNECPAEWTVIELADHAADGMWVYEGDSTESENHGAGTCGGGGPSDVLAFVAPAAGAYNAVIDAPAGDTLMYARTACGVGGLADYELACNDDFNDLLSGISFELEADETAYIFVDGFQGGFAGPYTLTVSAGALEGAEPPPPPPGG
jgi:hypothetical protein